MKKAESGQLNSIERLLGNLEGRVETLIDTVKDNRAQNDKEHKQIMDSQDKLCEHVNHENELMRKEIKANKEEITKRVVVIEDQHQDEKSMKKGQKTIYKIVIAVLSLIVTLMAIGTGFGIF